MLIGFVITALVLGMVGQVFTAGFNTSDRAARTANAAALARSVLAATGIEEPLAPGLTRGVFANGFGWERQVEAASGLVSAPQASTDGRQATNLQLFRVTVTILWPGGGDGVSVMTYRLAPATAERRR